VGRFHPAPASLASNDSHAGIIGGVIGGIVSLIALVLLYLCIRLRHRCKTNVDAEHNVNRVTSRSSRRKPPRCSCHHFSQTTLTQRKRHVASTSSPSQVVGGGSVYIAGDPRAAPHGSKVRRHRWAHNVSFDILRKFCLIIRSTLEMTGEWLLILQTFG
jgi:hypothetical protein